MEWSYYIFLFIFSKGKTRSRLQCNAAGLLPWSFASDKDSFEVFFSLGAKLDKAGKMTMWEDEIGFFQDNLNL